MRLADIIVTLRFADSRRRHVMLTLFAHFAPLRHFMLAILRCRRRFFFTLSVIIAMRYMAAITPSLARD